MGQDNRTHQPVMSQSAVHPNSDVAKYDTGYLNPNNGSADKFIPLAIHATSQFLLLNVSSLFLSSGKCKAKLRYLEVMSSLQTFAIALCETFLSDDISDSEIYMK